MLPKAIEENGLVINVNKPIGKTSFDVIARVRSLSKIKKVGHAGTLDPNATGVLVVALGKATKKIESLMTGEKVYLGTVRLGVETDTYDIEGKVLNTDSVDKITLSMIEEKLKEFSGWISQVPPRFSALKYKGRPMYEYARKGIVIEPEPRDVHVEMIEVVSYDAPDLVIRINCGKGTYIRSIAHDLGQALGCGGMLNDLVRERVGSFLLEDSWNWAELPEKLDSILKTDDGNI